MSNLLMLVLLLMLLGLLESNSIFNTARSVSLSVPITLALNVLPSYMVTFNLLA